MPLALDQGLAAGLEPAGMGTAYRPHPSQPTTAHGQPLCRSSVATSAGPQVSEEYLFKVVDALDEVAAETGKTIPQIALNWLWAPLHRHGHHRRARREPARDNLGAVGWSLTAEQVAKLDCFQCRAEDLPYWHQAGFSERNPFPTGA